MYVGCTVLLKRYNTNLKKYISNGKTIKILLMHQQALIIFSFEIGLL